MNILALYPFLPYPAQSGARLRGVQILQVLVKGHSVQLLSLLGRDDLPSRLPEWSLYKSFVQPPQVMPSEGEQVLSADAAQLRLNVPRHAPAWLQSFDHAWMWNRLAEIDLHQVDAVHIRYAYMAAYALALKKRKPQLRLVVDLDDVPSVLQAAKVRLPRSLAQLAVVQWEVRQLIRTRWFERRALGSFDSIWVCSSNDRERLPSRVRQHTIVVENVVDTEALARIHKGVDIRARPTLLFVGDFVYRPNREGAIFFVKEAWPRIRSAAPHAELCLVGNCVDPEMWAWNGSNGITVTGRVPEVGPFLARASVSIAPILQGAGTRIKILEAMAAGLPVVATRLGMQGIAAKDGVHLLVADTAEAFAQSCLRLLREPEKRAELGAAGRALVAARYSLATMSRAVRQCYGNLGGLPPESPAREVSQMARDGKSQ